MNYIINSSASLRKFLALGMPNFILRKYSLLRNLAIFLSLRWICSTFCLFVTPSLYLSRRSFLGTALLTSVTGFLSTFSPNYIVLLIFCFFVGVGLGGGSVFTTRFLEFVPTDNRGKWMVVFSTFWTFGTIFEASLAWVCFISFSNIDFIPFLTWS